jgi:RHS repeat-associated protein
MYEQHSNTESYNNPYKFNGKELDPETNLYYYGARYYDSSMSMWLSLDPLAEVTMQSYSAFNNNPIRYNDPTGMIAEEGDPNKKNWVGRQWDKVKSWFSSDDEYKPITKSNSQSKATAGELVYNGYEDPGKKVGDGWYANGSLYEQINPSTILVTNLTSLKTTYSLSLPQNMGTWGQEGSDGQIWIGCMSCHADNGAYRFAADHSNARAAGLIISMLLPTSGFKSMLGVSKTINSIDDVMANPRLLAGKTPAQVDGALAKTPE